MTGAGLLAAGGILPCLTSTRDYDKIDDGGKKPKSTNQPAANALQTSVDRNAYRANLLWIIGGTLGVVGGALVFVDRLVLAGSEPTLNATAGGVRASFTWQF